MARSVTVAGNFPGNHLQLLAFGRNVRKKLTNNTRCPTPPVSLSDLDTLLDDFEATIGKRGAGTASARRDARAKLESALRQIEAYVEGVASKVAPEEVTSTIEGAGFSEKKRGKFDKPPFAIVRDDLEGSVLGKVKAVAPPGSIFYCYAHSLDDGKTWLERPPTSLTTFSLTGLPVGTWVSFRFRTLDKNGVYGDWSQTLKLLIH